MADIFKWLFGSRGDAVKAGSDGAIDPDDPRVPGFPPELLAYHKQIEATRRPILAATELEGLPERTDGSQLGGLPWWPVDRAFPTDSNGVPLHLLIQINFDDAPVLEGYPDRGLLQFFIGDNGLLGMKDAKYPEAFACIYHETTDAVARSRFDDIPFPAEYDTPLLNPENAVPLSFQLATMIVDVTADEFDDAFSDIADDDESNEQFRDLIADLNADVAKIRLGGYPTFTQSDPRSYGSDGITTADMTLLTIDTTPNIMWGDVGVASFYIDPDDLAARDFSKVIYYWDCC